MGGDAAAAPAAPAPKAAPSKSLDEVLAAMPDPDDEPGSLSLILDMILEHAPPPPADVDAPLTMWVSTLCFLFCRRWTLYQKQVPSRLESPAHRGDFIIDVLEGIHVLKCAGGAISLYSLLLENGLFHEYPQHTDTNRRCRGFFLFPIYYIPFPGCGVCAPLHVADWLRGMAPPVRRVAGVGGWSATGSSLSQIGRLKMISCWMTPIFQWLKTRCLSVANGGMPVWKKRAVVPRFPLKRPFVRRGGRAQPIHLPMCPL